MKNHPHDDGAEDLFGKLLALLAVVDVDKLGDGALAKQEQPPRQRPPPPAWVQFATQRIPSDARMIWD